MTQVIEKIAERHGLGLEQEIYTSRFSPQEDLVREIVWDVLVEKFFQPLIPASAVVLDIGAGDGLFTKRISAKRRIALDLSPHVQDLACEGIEVVQVPADQVQVIGHRTVDVIFMSNFLEHLPDKRYLVSVLEECRQVLKPGGKMMILQPNIRYVGVAYWDYIDHHIALTERSLVEALEITGYEVVQLIPRFLPYTAKSRLGHLIAPRWARYVAEFYLKTPVLWRLFGKQTFVVAARGAD